MRFITSRNIILIILFLLVISVPLFMSGEVATFVLTRGQNTFNLVTIVLGTLGCVASLALIGLVLYQYIQYFRPHRLIFEGLNNEADLSNLTKTKKMPANLSKLAKEALISQFKDLYNQLNRYYQLSSNSFWPNTLLEEQEEGESEEDILFYLLPLPASKGNILTLIIARNLVSTLGKILDSLGDQSTRDYVKSIAAVAPKEVAPVINVMDSILPPHITKATGYLQLRNHNSDDGGETGITIEVIDVRKETSFNIHTFWLSEEKDTNRSTVESYSSLIRPAMRWLALTFWEQQVLFYISRKESLPKTADKTQLQNERAGLFYLLGVLYYASARQFIKHQNFFYQCAIEHLQDASREKPDWYMPYLFGANAYFYIMQKAPSPQVHDESLGAALELYDRALNTDEAKSCTDIRCLIEVCKAIAQRESGDNLLVSTAREYANNNIASIDLTLSDSNPTDCAIYLYHLAKWYAIEKNEKDARRCLVYSMARSSLLWPIAKYEVFKKHQPISNLCTRHSLNLLIEAIKQKEPNLASYQNGKFKAVLKEALQDSSWSDVIESDFDIRKTSSHPLALQSR